MNIFQILDNVKWKKKYTPEAIDLFRSVFATIGQEFDENEDLRIQLKGYTKKEYDMMVSYLRKIIIEEVDMEWSRKVALNKLLEGDIFKYLDDIHNFNTFCVTDIREEKNQIDTTIAYIYKLEETGCFAQPEEIELCIDDTVYKKPEQIKDMIWKSGKKTKSVLFKNNIEYNKNLEAHRSLVWYKIHWTFLKDKYEVQKIIPELELRLPERFIDATFLEDENDLVKVNLDEISFVTETLETLPILDKKEVIKNVLLRQQNMYFCARNYLRKINNIKIIIPVNFETLERKNTNKYYDKYRDITLSFSKKVRYYNYIKELQVQRIVYIRTVEGYKFTAKSRIKDFLENCRPDTVFQVAMKQNHTTRVELVLGCLDFALFYLLNPDMLETSHYGKDEIPEDNYIIKPTQYNLRGFALWVDTFLEKVQKKYTTQYEDTKIIDLMLNQELGKENFNKKSVNNYKRPFETKLDSMVINTKFFPKVLED